MDDAICFRKYNYDSCTSAKMLSDRYCFISLIWSNLHIIFILISHMLSHRDYSLQEIYLISLCYPTLFRISYLLVVLFYFIICVLQSNLIFHIYLIDVLILTFSFIVVRKINRNQQYIEENVIIIYLQMYLLFSLLMLHLLCKWKQ